MEDADYAGASARFMDGLGRRAGANLEALAALAAILREGRALLALAVAGARAQGYSDAEIGAALGVTRQRVGQRFGRKRDVDGPGPPTAGDYSGEGRQPSGPLEAAGGQAAPGAP